MIEIFYILLIFVSGVLSGILNIMAGGGSTITLGVMIFMGMDASVANGTNRIGLMVESTSGVLAFKSENYSEFKESFKLAFWTLPGAIIGAIYAIKISNEMFQQILAFVMILILFTLFIPKSKEVKHLETAGKRKIFIYPTMFAIGFYGGFIQVGIGFILMGALRHILNLDLVRVNMHKIFIVFIYTIPLLFVFGFTGNIHWFYAFFLACGYAAGAWWSAKVSIKKGEKVIKLILAIAIIIMSTKLLLG